MTNAAIKLADLFDQWLVPRGHTPEAERGFDSDEDLDAWRRHHQAAELVATVDQALQGMNAAGDNVAVFERYLPKWYAGVHFASTQFGSTNSNLERSPCPSDALDMLRALGILMTANGELVLDEDQRRSIIDTLTRARELLGHDTTMPKDVRAYVGGLILRAQMVLEHVNTYGPESVRQVILELGGALHAQGEREERNGNTESGRQWKATAFSLMIGFVGGVGEGFAGLVGDTARRAIEK